MSAIVLHGKGDLRIDKQAPEQKLQAHEVRIRMRSVGICGSDVHYVDHMRIADFIVKEPMVMGHESAGTIIEVGSGVTHLKPGDNVALEPGISCGDCEFCPEKYNLCREMKFFATPPVHGSLQSTMVHPGNLCFKLPSNVSTEEGACCEPLSVGVYACDRANVKEGDCVAIFGAGPIGLITLLVASAYGAKKITITDIDESRLAFAKALKVAAEVTTIPIRNSEGNFKSNEEVIGEIKNAFGGLASASIECCGKEAATQQAVGATTSGATVVCVGMNDDNMNLPVLNTFIREVDIRGVFRYRYTYTKCIELISSGKLDVTPLITHRYYPFDQDQLLEAFDTARTGRDGAIKVMFNLDGVKSPGRVLGVNSSL